MAILIASSRIVFPDASSPEGGAHQLLDRAKDAISNFLTAADARIFNNSFVDDGTQNVSGSSFIDSKFSDLVKPNRRQTISQAPQATLLLKKRMFATLRSNYDLRFMDDDERIFMRAIKNLFRRKCEEIAFYENLIVLEKIVEDPEFLNINSFLDTLLNAFFAVIDLGFGVSSDIAGPGTTFLNSIVPNPSVLFRLKKIQERARQSSFTTWIVDPDTTDFGGTGAGVGVIEFTWMNKIDTTVSLETGGGKCNITIEDPYRLTRITETDIDLALKQALDEESGPAGFFETTGQIQLDQAQTLDRELNKMRRDRGVSEINFEFDPRGKEPFGEIVQTGFAFTEQSINEVPDDQALTATEVVRFINIIFLLKSYRSIQDRAVNSVQNDNQNFSVIRQKLRQEFVGHHIFQQMDAVHVFVNSFTRHETPIYGNRGEPLSPDSVQNVITFEEQTAKISDDALEVERQFIAPEMSLFEYKAYRNPTEWRGTGPQIFSGLVTNIRSHYSASDGKFILNVSASDNTEFLSLSRFNFQPSLTQPQGVLFDPLTPYDIRVDETSGLIIGRTLSNTNQKRLKFLKFDDGTLLGEPVETEDRLIQDTAAGVSSILAYQHVPGLVYKWKHGIISATQEINLTRPLDRSKSILGDVADDFGLTVSGNPFANLDSADIMSILITGQPYNYNNFLQNVLDAGNYTLDNDTNNRSYFNYLFDFLERQDQTFGNFVPAKASSIDPEVVANVFREQRRLLTISSQINDLQRRRALKQDKLNSVGNSNQTDEIKELMNAVQADLNDISAQIDSINNAIDLSGLQLGQNAAFKTFGDAIQIHFTEDDIDVINRRLKYILKKKPEEVRYNQDKNFFVVADQYDSDFDIQSFVLELKNSFDNIFQSEWKDTKTICNQVANTIDFEFFADSQGNLQFRPPQYNKTPLSLLLKMVEMGQTDGISLAPPFLLKLLSSRDVLVRQELLQIELEILEQTTLLSLSAIDLVFKYHINLALILNDSGNFDLDTNLLFQSLNEDSIFTEKDQTDAVFNHTLGTLSASLEDQINILIQVKNQLTDLKGSTTGKLDPDNTDDADIVLNELSKFEPNHTNSFVNRLNASNKIAQLVSKRQSLARIYQKLVDEEQSLGAANDGQVNFNTFSLLWQTASSELFSSDHAAPVFPKVLQPLIEDDLSNADGFNSGKRYIIDDDVIIEMDFSIEMPRFNHIDVNGNQNLVGGSIIGKLPLTFWAGATDFDSWRQFGFRVDQSLERPFIQNPETQGAPYAIFKLLQQRKFINSGTITLVGNEFYQAGDVVYVNNRQMLYYVSSVSQSVDVSTGVFRTTLNLTYGHALGEYIPTPLDAIGKAMLSDFKQHHGAIKANRSSVPSVSVVHLETLTFPITSEADSVARELLVSPDGDTADLSERNNLLGKQFSNLNITKVQNALLKAATRINATNQDYVRIELRGYYIGGIETIARTQANLSYAQEMLVQGLLPASDIQLSGDFSITVDNQSLNPVAGKEMLQIGEDKILVLPPIDLEKTLTGDDALFRRMPSAQAWAAGSDVIFGVATGLPINSVDIFLVINKNRTADQTVPASTATHSVVDQTVQTSLSNQPFTPETPNI